MKRMHKIKGDYMQERILNSLINGYLSFFDILRSYDINLAVVNHLSSNILGMVYKTKRQNYVIVLNGNINYETQCKVFLHELYHIENHMPTMGYCIGLDMQHTPLELEAEKA